MWADVWRSLVSVADYRRALRLLLGKPKLDVVFITNVRDEAERRRFFGPRSAGMAHAAGPRLHLKGVAGEVRGLNLTAEEMLTREGRRKAKAAFVDAVAWAERQGARVILLAASTKRLFGHDGLELKQRFPHMLFTIGDNGTAQLLCPDVDRAIQAAGLAGRRPRILVIGPYGHLGRAVSAHLLAQGREVMGYGANAKLLAEFRAEFDMPVTTELELAGQFDLVVCCTHSAEARLDAARIRSLRKAGRKLLVVDVAEPANLGQAVYRECREVLVRQDAGNAHAAGLRHVLGRFSRDKLNLASGTVFGCFAEAMALFQAVYREHNHVVLSRNWFEINAFRMALVKEAFRSLGLGLPAAHCFGRPVRSFDLAVEESVLPEGLRKTIGLGAFQGERQAA